MDDDELAPGADPAPPDGSDDVDAPEEGDSTAELQTDPVGLELARASLALGIRRPYGHVARLFYERPWAVRRATLDQMDQILQRRLAGGRLSREELDQILASARADQGSDGPSASGAYYLAGAAAVIPMYGILAQRASMFADTSTSGVAIDELRLSLREALADPQVRSIVFDIHSPGGSVDGVTEFAAELRAARAGSKPIVAQVNTLAASAAYWLASQMSEIVMSPSGEVGSIGVYAMHEDVSKAAEMKGVTTTLVSAGKYKVEGNQFEPLTDEARGAIQDQVDTFYNQFLGDVAKGRSATPTAVADGYGEGRTMLAAKALEAGMVDRIDPLEATVRRLQPRGATSRQPAAAVIPLQPAALAASKGAPDRAWNRRMKGKSR